MSLPPSHSILQTTIFTLTFHFLLFTQASKNPDFKPLIAFKTSTDTFNKLTTWNTTTNLCTWYGVSCLRNRVSRLVLENLELHGSIELLTSLTHLRVLSLKRNRFNGPIPNLSNLTSLRLLFLSYNNFSGEFPATLTSLTRLYRLDLSHNNLSGEIPVNVNSLFHLLTLRLDGNQIQGHIPKINLSYLQDFNVSGNFLSGRIPESLSDFSDTSFAENPALCGSPLQKCKDIPALASSLVPSSSSSIRGNQNHRNGAAPKMKTIVLLGIILGDVSVLAVVSLLLYCYFWRNHSKKGKEIGESNSKSVESENQKMVYVGQQGMENGTKMVFFGGAKRFELEDLLRASAEMLGKGSFGSVYKAVLDDGSVMAVKRLKEIQIGGKREFEQRMEVLGKLRHSNIVSLKAYYFAKDEKLIVFDYMVNGSLFWLLHGNRGPGRTPLDWTTRLKIAAGAAQGVAFIHNHYNLTHGNIKSTNILVDVSGTARVADFGLSIFTVQSNKRSNGYRAPETSDSRKQSQKSDVYAFGVLLMEILTGKCPSTVDGGEAVELPRWVRSVVREEWTAEIFDLELMRYKDSEEEMVALLQIAMMCTVTVPDQRPKMCHVVKRIEELRGVDVSLCHDTLDSVSKSSSVSEDASGGGGAIH